MKYLYVLYIMLFSCNKLVDIPQSNSFITSKTVSDNKDLRESLVASLYDDLYILLNNQGAATNPENNLSIIFGATADDFTAVVDFTREEVRNAYTNMYFDDQSMKVSNFFSPFYKLIIRCNIILDMINEFNDEENIQNVLEIKAIRSIAYFYLVQIYEKVPLITSSDIDENISVTRISSEEIYNFCISELEYVYNNINDHNLKINKSIVNNNYTERINKNVASYYLSAFFLLSKKYEKSIEYSLILKNKFSFDPDFQNKFKLASTENIWLLNPSFPGNPSLHNNANAAFLNYKIFGAASPFASSTRNFSISDSLVSYFTSNDKRKIYFIDSVFHDSKYRYLSYKYKSGGRYEISSPERFVLIRLPMIYFNLIEAYYFNGQKELSTYYYNLICSQNYTEFINTDKLNIHDIIKERHKELHGELGDRWFTLKRVNLIDSIMNIYLPLKTNNMNSWNRSNMLYFPIPFNELLLNPNL